MNVGSLFSGIGGFDLGLERAGMRTAWFCEQDAYCQRVLAKHWPGVPCYPDITELRGCDVEPVAVLVGGFPCQDISAAGKGAGLAGARSGLWSEYARLVGELRPRYVIVENVPMLRKRGLDQVLQDLDACGYDAEWDGISASAVGAPHRRDRIWIVAYPNGQGEHAGALDAEVASASAPTADANGAGRPHAERREGSAWPYGRTFTGSDHAFGGLHHWTTESGVDRVVDRLPPGMDRLRALGNALVPQIAEWLGRRIVTYEATR
jgi:DNA (cytosine-5)-methyltransferase 1